MTSENIELILSVMADEIAMCRFREEQLRMTVRKQEDEIEELKKQLNAAGKEV